MSANGILIKGYVEFFGSKTKDFEHIFNRPVNGGESHNVEMKSSK